MWSKCQNNNIKRHCYTKLIHNYNEFNKYNQDDGQEIEPVYFAPILPMVLINGSQGIGTGWSTDIPKYNPLDILANIKNNLEGNGYIDMIPYSHGFKGTISKKTDKTFISKLSKRQKKNTAYY